MRARLAAHVIAARSRDGRSRPGLRAAPRALATALGVDPGALTTRAVARPLLVTGGTIEGKVTSSASNAPLAGIEVCAFEPEAFVEPEELPFFKCTTTDAGGEYTLAELPLGSYVVEFFAPIESGLNYQTQFYKGQARERNANPVVVKGGEATPEIDAALLPGGEISGTVSSAVTKGALANVLVCAFDEAEESGNCAFTEPSGAYTVSGLPTGSYIVAFIPFEEEGSAVSYAIQFYNGAPTEALANDVSVVAGGAPTPNIDASLVESVPRERSNPGIAGSAVAGQTLTVVHASWTNSPTSIVDVWGRCNSVGASCFVAGTGPSYMLTPSDVGHTFFVRETAFDPAGESQPAFSPLSAIVAPAPPVPAPITAAPTVAPATGVLSSTSATASAAQLRSLLARLLAPSGRNAKIGQLLKHRGYSVSFQALTAGKLTISWYLVPKGARLSGAKPVLAASGSVSPAAAGAAKLTIKLTARGRGLLSHAGRLSLTARGSLAASAGATVHATKAFTVRR